MNEVPIKKNLQEAGVDLVFLLAAYNCAWMINDDAIDHFFSTLHCPARGLAGADLVRLFESCSKCEEALCSLRMLALGVAHRLKRSLMIIAGSAMQLLINSLFVWCFGGCTN